MYGRTVRLCCCCRGRRSKGRRSTDGRGRPKGTLRRRGPREESRGETNEAPFAPLCCRKILCSSLLSSLVSAVVGRQLFAWILRFDFFFATEKNCILAADSQSPFSFFSPPFFAFLQTNVLRNSKAELSLDQVSFFPSRMLPRGSVVLTGSIMVQCLLGEVLGRDRH